MTKQPNALKGPDLLNHFEDNWQTEMGALFIGERVVLRGKDVFAELSDYRWVEYLVFAITGKHSPKIARIIEGLWTIATSYPDPRPWNNRVAALAGTTRSTGVLAIAAGIAVSEATIYGSKPIKGALDFLYRAAKQKDQGVPLKQIVQDELKINRSVSGFGRPILDVDERIAPVLNFIESMGVERGRFVELAFEIEDYFKTTRYKYRMNIAALNAAIAADHGLSADEYYYLTSLAFVAGMFPCYIDALDKPEGGLFPLSVTRLNSDHCKPYRVWGN